MRERRKFPRVDFEIKMKVYGDEHYKHLITDDCKITNISKIGISFDCHKNFEVGDKYYMRFMLIGGLNVSFLGEIYWRKGSKILYSYGVKYLKVGWFSMRNLEKSLLSQFFPEKKNRALVFLEYILLFLLIAIMIRLLNELPLGYTILLFTSFIGVFYYVLLRLR